MFRYAGLVVIFNVAWCYTKEMYLGVNRFGYRNCERYFVAAFTSELYLPKGDINSLVLLKDIVHYFVHVLYHLVTCMCRCPFKNPFIDSLKDIVIVYI